MLTTLFDWMGFSEGALSNINAFWSTPAGLLISGSIFACCSFNVMHKSVDDDVFDRIWYSIVAVLMLIALIVGLNPETISKHIIQTLLLLLWIKFVASSVQHYIRWRRTGCSQKSK